MDMSGIIWYEVLAAALSGFVLGGVWYGPLFGKRWQGLVGLSDERIAEANMLFIFGATFCLNLFMAAMLSLFLMVGQKSGAGVVAGASFGLLVGLAFVVPTFAINYLFARQPVSLFGIDAGYMCLQLAVMGAIIGTSF